MLPEERVRTALVTYMVQSLGYPRAHLVIEKELALLPHLVHLSTEGFPKRRVDILAYQKRGEELLPLLLIECKAAALKEGHAQQLISYNSFVGAPYLALCNGEETLFASAADNAFRLGLPSYHDILCIK